MPEQTPTDSTADDFEKDPAPVAARPTTSREPVQVSSPQPRWLAPVALLIAVVAVGLAVWSLVSSPTTGGGGDKASLASGGDPKGRVCTAFDVVSRAVQSQTNNNLGEDPIAQSAVAGNARLALFGGGVYLENSIGTDAPSDLAEPTARFATALQTIGMYALAGVTNADPAQAARLSDADADRKQIVELCK